MKILTYNLWHGFNGKGLIRFGQLEPSGRRQLRYHLQDQLLLNLEPDICCFQEVLSPLNRAQVWKENSCYWSQVQADSKGLKLLGAGLPINLNSGLVNLVSANLLPRSLGSLKLSGHRSSFINSWLSFQLAESRYALFTEFQDSQFGRVLVVNAHLHHGLECTDKLLDKFRELFRNHSSKTALWEEVESRLKAGNNRRQSELQLLLSAISELKSSYGLIILAGDLNCGPDSQVYSQILSAGFKDTVRQALPDADKCLTWDLSKNQDSAVFMQAFPSSVVLEDLSFDRKMKLEMSAIIRQHELSPRRIDYIFFIDNIDRLQNINVEMLGFAEKNNPAPSDHYGVLVELC